MLDCAAMRRPLAALLLPLCAALVACGGEVGGTVSGLGTGLSVTLQNNGGDALRVAENGSFTFNDQLQANASYAVTVQTQPAGQVCSVANGSGTLNDNGDSIDSVRVSCAFSASLRGTLTGLQPGVSLILGNGTATLAISTNGPWAFAETLADDTAYDVVITVPPLFGNCTVRNGAGRFVLSTFVPVEVDCQ
jgi:hypothetical protein